MDYTVQELDEICVSIERMSEQMAHPGFGMREETIILEVVQLIQRVGELIAWAYGQQQRPSLGEQFAQPFVDRRLRDRLKALLTERRPMRRELQSRLAAQVLQTIHILLQATPTDSTLFCNLTAGWYLNAVVSAQPDFRENEDLLPLWMTVVKDIATMLNRDNMMLFFDPGGEKPFPIYTEAVRYYHHPVSQVRTHVQAISLEVFLKLRDESLWSEPLFELVLSQSCIFFTHVCCLLRDFWRMADEAVQSGARRDVRSALHIQNDILMYLGDVFSCEIPQLSAILQEKLLRFAVLPVLVESVLWPQAAAPQASRLSARRQAEKLSPRTARYLLQDLLGTLKSSPVVEAVALALLRPRVPEQVLELAASSPPPRTPTQYYATQASWGVSARPGPFDQGDTTSDEVLYAMPAVPLLGLLDNRDRTRLLMPNSLLDVLQDQFISLSMGGEADQARSVLASLTLLLRTFSTAREVLDGGVAERLGGALCGLLALHRQLPWALLGAVLTALREVTAAANSPPGRARLILGPKLREQVLFPLASELMQTGARQPVASAAQDAWLQEFQEQWAATRIVSNSEMVALQRQRELLEQGSLPDPWGPEGRARCIRVLLGAWQLAVSLTGGVAAAKRQLEKMPGLDEAEVEEAARYRPGVPVHIGKMNRVKCYAHGARQTVEEEALYLLPVQATLMLVRPDEQKPFWAVPVISEPLRQVRVLAQGGGERAAKPLEQLVSNGEEQQRILRLEVMAPRSPFFHKAYADSGPGSTLARFTTGAMERNGPDQLSMTLGGALPLGGPAAAVAGQDLMSMTVPSRGSSTCYTANGSSACYTANSDDRENQEVLGLTLVFSDERRRRVSCKILAQARHAVSQRMADGIAAFLTEVRDDPT